MRRSEKDIMKAVAFVDAANDRSIDLMDENKIFEAVACLDEALVLGLDVLGEGHASVANTYCDLGGSWEAVGDFEMAIGYFEKAAVSAAAALGKKHKIAKRFRRFWKRAIERQEKFDRAYGYYERALKGEFMGLDESEAEGVIQELEIIYGYWCCGWEPDKVISCCELIVSVLLGAFDEGDPKVVFGLVNLACAFESKGELDDAIVCYERALAGDLMAAGEEPWKVADYLDGLAGVWRVKGEFDKEIACYQRALLFELRWFEEAPLHYRLGVAWREKGDLHMAIECFRKSILCWQDSDEGDREEMFDVMRELAGVEKMLAEDMAEDMPD